MSGAMPGETMAGGRLPPFPWGNLVDCSPKSCHDHLGLEQACITARLKMVDSLWILWTKRLRSA